MEAVGVSAPRAASSVVGAALVHTREVLARAEVLLEVAWRGVRP
jgi:vancomycin permeability regulator SanA